MTKALNKPPHPGREAPIGIFDSGVGGLTVMRALMEALPHEDLLYFGDTARVPYGIKSNKTITLYSKQITKFLLQSEVKLLVIACNTMAAVAKEAIKRLAANYYQQRALTKHPAPWNVPVVDVLTAGAEQAVLTTKNQRVGIIGTLSTINSHAYIKAIHALNPAIQIFTAPCPLFVPLIEEDWLTHPATKLIAEEYLAPILKHDLDTLVLGCTHYPLLKPLLQEIVGKGVKLIDSAMAVAKITKQLLTTEKLKKPRSPGRAPTYRFYVTDIPLRFTRIQERFLGQNPSHIQIINW